MRRYTEGDLLAHTAVVALVFLVLGLLLGGLFLCVCI